MHQQRPFDGAKAFLHAVLTFEQGLRRIGVQVTGIGSQGIPPVQGLRFGQSLPVEAERQPQGLILTAQLHLHQPFGWTALLDRRQTLFHVGPLFVTTCVQLLLDVGQPIQQPFEMGAAFLRVQTLLAGAPNDQDAVGDWLPRVLEGEGTPHPLVGHEVWRLWLHPLRAVG